VIDPTEAHFRLLVQQTRWKSREKPREKSRVVGTSTVCRSAASGMLLSVMEFIIGMLLLGIVAGYLARLLVPGPDPMSFVGTILLGIVGSFAGGFLGWLLFGEDLDEGALQTSGIIGSVIGAIVVLILYNAMSRRTSRI
jgi:uncharacterized membrane protein YeaQ/YmgE (transglycosylase-associated protein family)